MYMWLTSLRIVMEFGSQASVIADRGGGLPMESRAQRLLEELGKHAGFGRRLRRFLQLPKFEEMHAF